MSNLSFLFIATGVHWGGVCVYLNNFYVLFKFNLNFQNKLCWFSLLSNTHEIRSILQNSYKVFLQVKSHKDV
jgi:hypothetical protein